MTKENKLLDEIGKIDESLVPDLEEISAGSEAGAEEASAADGRKVISDARLQGAKKDTRKGGKANRRNVILLSVGGVLAAALLAFVIIPKVWKNKGSVTGSKPEEIAVGQPGNEEGLIEGQIDGQGIPKSGETVVYAHQMAAPQYPEIGDSQDQFNEWLEAVKELRNQPEGYQDGYDAYCQKVVAELFSDVGQDNRVFSPLSLYMALSMTAEVTDGATRQQILDLLCQPDVETLRERAKSIWLANYMNDGIAKLILGNSMWLNSSREYKAEVLDILARQYFASSFSGDPASEEYSREYQAWINEQTDDFLKEMVEGISLDPGMQLTLASTVNYEAKWTNPFTLIGDDSVIFHAPSGDVKCDFMYSPDAYENYYGEKFVCVSIYTIYNGQMRFILPNEGVTPEELLQDEEALRFLTAKPRTWDKTRENVQIELYVPKFDISSELDLKGYMQALGIEDAFSAEKADFSPLTDQSGIMITSIDQDARLMIDENGCKAAAVTEVVNGAGAPEVQMVFRVDRPFVFELVSETGLPIFVGVVNDPS